MTVAAHEGFSQTRLVELTGIDRATLAAILNRLKQKRLLHRRRTKQDARTYAVTLTEEGRRLLKVAEPLARSVDDRILSALGSRRDDFMRALMTIVDGLERAREWQRLHDTLNEFARVRAERGDA